MKQNNAKTENNVTELVFILDRSGSMAGLESDTIGGFNAMIEKQKKQEGRCWVSTFLFSNASELVHDRVSLEAVKPMTADDYVVGGCTALIDAIGDAIAHVSSIHKYARAEDVPAHTVFVITTDGMETPAASIPPGRSASRLNGRRSRPAGSSSLSAPTSMRWRPPGALASPPTGP